METPGIEYHPLNGDAGLREKKATSDLRWLSGDAGNRTRVRKIRPSEIYERSRSKVVATGISSGRNRLLSSRYVFCTCSGVACSAPRLSRPGLSLAEIGAGGRGLAKKTVLL